MVFTHQYKLLSQAGHVVGAVHPVSHCVVQSILSTATPPHPRPRDPLSRDTGAPSLAPPRALLPGASSLRCRLILSSLPLPVCDLIWSIFFNPSSFKQITPRASYFMASAVVVVACINDGGGSTWLVAGAPYKLARLCDVSRIHRYPPTPPRHRSPLCQWNRPFSLERPLNVLHPSGQHSFSFIG